MVNHSMNPYRYKQLQSKARARSQVCVVGGLITNEQGQAFVLKRPEDVKFLPNCWYIPSGQVKEDESLFGALARVILEETGWHLTDILEELRIFEWRLSNGGPVQSRLEFDFQIKVQGDLDHPKFEPGKSLDYRWISIEELDLLQEVSDLESLDFLRMAEKVLEKTNPG